MRRAKITHKSLFRWFLHELVDLSGHICFFPCIEKLCAAERHVPLASVGLSRGKGSAAFAPRRLNFVKQFSTIRSRLWIAGSGTSTCTARSERWGATSWNHVTSINSPTRWRRCSINYIWMLLYVVECNPRMICFVFVGVFCLCCCYGCSYILPPFVAVCVWACSFPLLYPMFSVFTAKHSSRFFFNDSLSTNVFSFDSRRSF